LAKLPIVAEDMSVQFINKFNILQAVRDYNDETCPPELRVSLEKRQKSSASCGMPLESDFPMQPICKKMQDDPLKIVFYLDISRNVRSYQLSFYAQIITSVLKKLAAVHITNNRENRIIIKKYSKRGYGTQIDNIWSSERENIVLNLPEGKTGQLYLADVLEQLETEVTNKKHITNQPAKVEDAVAEIDRDVSKNHKNHAVIVIQGASVDLSHAARQSPSEKNIRNHILYMSPFIDHIQVILSFNKVS